MSAKPGEMHEVDRAFYELTVAQRNQAWADVVRLQSEADAERALADDLAADVERLQVKLNSALDELAYHECVAERRYERNPPGLARYQKARQL